MTTTTKAVTVSAHVSSLVDGYVRLALAKNESVFAWVAMSSGYSVAQIKDSIKQAKKESGISLPDLTPTKAQHFATLNAIVAKFPEVEQTMTFAKVYGIAEKSDRAFGAETARKNIAKAESVESFVEILPATVRAPKIASEKETQAQGLSADNVGDLLLALADSLDSDKRARLVSTLVAVSKAIQLTTKPIKEKANA
jgi:hypothetical protein